MRARFPSAPEEWPRQYERLLEGYAARPTQELLARATELASALGRAGVPLREIAQTHMAVLCALAPRQSAAEAFLASATALFTRFSEAYDAARQPAQQALGRQCLPLDGLHAEQAQSPEKLAERGQSGGALLESEGLLHQLAENIHEVFWLTEPRDRRTFYVSPAYEQMFGLPLADVYAHPRVWLEAVHPEDRARVEADMERQELGVATEHEYRIVRPDGAVRWIRGRAFPVRDAAGQVYRVAGLAEDVTEQKAAAATLRESEERFRTVVEASQDALVVIGPEGRIIVFNPAAERMFGRHSTEMLGQPLDRLMPEADRARHRQYVHGFFSTGEPRGAIGRTLELRALRRDGEVFPIELSLSTGEFGGERFVLAVIRDITERKRAEEALRTSEANFRKLAETIPVAITITRGPRVLYVNSAAETVTGYSRQELVELESYWKVVHPDFRELVRERGVARECGEPVPSRYEIKLLTKGGEERWIDLSASFLDFDGAPATLATGVDVSERKRAEEALRASEAKFRTLAETVPVAIAITCGPRVLYVNSAVEAITGYMRGELQEVDFWSVVHPDFRDLVRQRGLAREGGEDVPARYEIKIVAKNGDERWVDLSASPFVFEGARAVLATGVDITDRKRAEEAARQHQEQLAHVARVSTLGEMASGLTHELAQPLSAILYYARSCAARLEAGAWGTTEAAAAVEKIAAQAAQAGEIVRRLKAFIRKAPMRRVPADMNAIVREALSLVLREARDHRVAIRLELAEGLPLVVIDAVQIEQVILNLVRNGIEAMRPAPREARELVIQTRAGPDERVCVLVEDHGPGVPAELEQRVFDPFFTTKPAGTGLGLTISRSIIEAHEGKLWVEAAPERGARFGFALPIARGNEHAGE